MIGPLAATHARPLTWVYNWRSGLKTAAASTLAGLALAACTGPGGDPTPAPPDPTPTAASTLPAPRPSTATPPEPPAAMERQDIEGAIAAAQYFLELYPYAYNTGDLSEWRAMSHPECIFCASVIENVGELHADGGYETGGEFLFESVDAHEPLPGNEFFGVDFALIQSAGSRHDSSGRTVDAGAETRLALYTALGRTSQGWYMRAVSLEEMP